MFKNYYFLHTCLDYSTFLQLTWMEAYLVVVLDAHAECVEENGE